MYAVIRTGGKQYKVEAGERLEVERLGVDDGTDVELTPVLLVDGDNVLATPAQLAGATVQARVIGATRGPKIDGFIYKPKSNNRRRYGHRQDLSVIEITGIGPAKKPRSRTKAKPAEAAEPEPAESAAVESEES
jgi:large subunit ribosomal protein L21